MSSQSLYRKWRSVSFDDIIGQPHVVQTLQNAIRHDLVAHAYLFTGPRGTGKTSTARVLAKAVNCINPRDGAPCAECALCISIANSSSPDVIEIDGASNNGIEDIRVLRERVAYSPAEGRFKVYIIDEVHRVTANAFDALLKTLEEPPEHVVFIFASTEPHKVPATILSRCQRFDFHKINRDDTLARVRHVANSEGLEVEDAALSLIAQQAAGSLRDALGILDQVRAFAGNEITVEHVRSSIGLGQPAAIADLTTHMLDGDTGAALKLIHESVSWGIDPRTVLRQLIDYWRALLLYTGNAAPETDIDPALETSAPTHASRLTLSQTIDVLRALTEQVIEPRLSVAPQLPLEIAVVQSILVLHGSPNKGVGSNPSSVNATARSSGSSGTPSQQSSQEMTRIGSGSKRAAESGQSTQAPQPVRNSTPASDSAVGVAENGGGSYGDSHNKTSTSFPDAWPLVVEAVRGKSRSLQAMLRHARLMETTDSELTLGFRYELHRDELDKPDNRLELSTAITEVTGRRFKVFCVMRTEESLGSKTDETDAFIEEAERMLRGVHARQFRSSK